MSTKLREQAIVAPKIIAGPQDGQPDIDAALRDTLNALSATAAGSTGKRRIDVLVEFLGHQSYTAAEISALGECLYGNPPSSAKLEQLRSLIGSITTELPTPMGGSPRVIDQVLDEEYLGALM